MVTGTQISRAGFEGPVMMPEDDRYGFTAISEGLARSICALDENISTVIGIEGRWGSGKTSLLNLLVGQLKTQMPAETVVLPFSPWLTSPDESPVTSLLLTVAARLAELDTSPQAMASKVSPLVQNVLNYAQQTSRRLAPLTDLAGEFIPGVGIVAKGMKAFAETDLTLHGKTTAELRQDIEQKISEMGINFVVIIDDLDRLEPAQAVEVLRMVRSVADFSRFRYVMCYDRDVLAHAVQNGLAVKDGLLYLQKIIPLAFSLPRPESFDLRREFLSGAIRLYESVNHIEPNEELINDLNMVVDLYGASLQTPREVQLTLNGLIFRYNGIRDYVYFPDLCFLQLMRTTNPGLYDWSEEYLTERAIMESGDGSVSEEEQKDLAQTLRECLSRFRSSEAKSVISLRHWLPGISGYKLDKLTLFSQTSDDEKAMMTANRRLGSTAYWRYYFAFSSPQNILPPAYFDELFRMAGNEPSGQALTEELLGKINSNGVSSRTWFEHILSQLTWPMINKHTASECAGLLAFFFSAGDEITARYQQRNRWFSRYDLDVNSVANRLLKRMLDDDRAKALKTLFSLTMKGASLGWIANYIRELLWQNGLAGNRAASEHERLLTDEELNLVRSNFCERLNSGELKLQLLQGGELGGFVWAWQDIAGQETLIAWISQHDTCDEAFLTLLLSLRSHGISSASGHYLSLKITEIAHLFGGEKELRERLSRIEAEGQFPDQTDKINKAIVFSKSF